MIARVVWFVSTAALVGTAAVLDLASGGMLQMVTTTVAMAVFGGIVAFGLTDERADRWLWARRGVVWSASGAVALHSLASVWGGLGVGVGAVLLLTSPAVVGAARRLFVSWSSRRTSGPPESLRTRDLRRRWEWTTTEVLHPSSSVSRRLALVEERRRLLDELQRRDPAGFDTWVASAVPVRPPDRQRPRRW